MPATRATRATSRHASLSSSRPSLRPRLATPPNGVGSRQFIVLSSDDEQPTPPKPIATKRSTEPRTRTKTKGKSGHGSTALSSKRVVVDLASDDHDDSLPPDNVEKMRELLKTAQSVRIPCTTSVIGYNQILRDSSPYLYPCRKSQF